MSVLPAEQDHWIRFLDAVRLIMSAMDGHERLSKIAINDWIEFERNQDRDIYLGDPHDEQAMLGKYGDDWRVARQDAQASCKRAIKFLRDILRKGLITGRGRDAPMAVRRAILPEEWHDLHIDLFTNAMSVEPRSKEIIEDILIDARDMLRELDAAGHYTSEPAGLNERKRFFTKKAIMVRRKELEGTIGKERWPAIIAAVAEHGVSISPRFAEKVWADVLRTDSVRNGA